MKFIDFSFNLITGFMIGVEWHPRGSFEDDEDPFGYVAIDLGILRVLVTYN